ncbi:HNH endonuclease family protein [Facklamia sp. P12934]|uniref:HNH endonuclease family protein n=1 Tax=Facklamia sp. P12934 TaxID=3421948 RepID=UPI003D1651B2
MKQNILNLNAEIINNKKPRIEFRAIEKNEIREELKNPHRNVVRMLLKLLAYDNKNQMELLPDKWEIEHILPKKWQESYFPNTSEEEVNNTIEHLGNKIPFEKRLNIVASNGYFTKKKEYYNKSNISFVQELSKTHLTDWKLEQIRERDIRISDRIMDIFDNWIATDPVNSGNENLSEEELKAIELIKVKGLENYL